MTHFLDSLIGAGLFVCLLLFVRDVVRELTK